MLALALNDPVSYVRHGKSDGLTLRRPGPSGLGSICPRGMAPFSAPALRNVSQHMSQHCLNCPAPCSTLPLDMASMASRSRKPCRRRLSRRSIGRRSLRLPGRMRRLPRFRIGSAPSSGTAFDVDWGDGSRPHPVVEYPPPLRSRRLRFTAAPRQVQSRCLKGRVLAVEFVPNEDRVSPPLQATFAFVMLATTPSGDAYTIDDLDQIARARRVRRRNSSFPCPDHADPCRV